MKVDSNEFERCMQILMDAEEEGEFILNKEIINTNTEH